MKPFYSIIHVPIRREVGEQITVGLIFGNEKNTFFRYSNEKLEAVKTLVTEPSAKLLKANLKSFELGFTKEKIAAIGFKPESSKIAEPNPLNRKLQLEYLASYSNNLLAFTDPEPIDLDFNENNFRALFRKWINKTENFSGVYSDDDRFDIKKYLNKNLIPKIESKVNANAQITTNVLDTLFLPVDVTFLGQNDNQVVGQGVDFLKKNYFVESDLAKIYTLVKAFEEKGKKHGKYFVIGQEPDASKRKNWDTWNVISKSKTVTFVPLDETEQVEEYIEKHGVHPFFDEK